MYFIFWTRHVAYGILVLQPGVEPVPPALKAQTLTPGPPGKSLQSSALMNSHALLPEGEELVLQTASLDIVSTPGPTSPTLVNDFSVCSSERRHKTTHGDSPPVVTVSTAEGLLLIRNPHCNLSVKAALFFLIYFFIEG